MAPFLSIIVPIYNTELYLRCCIESILGQTFLDYELLLIDDGSTDSSSDICKEYQKKDSRVHYHRKDNSGPLHTRLFGAKLARGEYFLFCDSDDYYKSKNSFDYLFHILQRNPCDLLQFGVYKTFRMLSIPRNSVKRTVYMDGLSFENTQYPRLLCSWWKDAIIDNSTCNKAYNRRLLEKIHDVNIRETVFWGDDLIINLHLLEHIETALFVPKCLYCYRQRSGGTNLWKQSVMNDLNVIKQEQLLFLNRWNGSEQQKNSILATLFFEIPGWFFVHIVQGIDFLPRNDLINYLKEILELPSFVAAKEYYLDHTPPGGSDAELLVQSNPETYLMKALERRKMPQPISQRVKSTIRRIL